MTLKTRTPGLKETLKALPDYYLALETSSSGFTVMGTSEALAERFGLDEARIVGCPLADGFLKKASDESVGRIEDAMNRSAEAKTGQDAGLVEIEERGKQKRAWRASVCPVVDRDNNVEYVILALREAAGQAVADGILQNQAGLFAMADAIPHMSWIMHRDGSPMYYNKLWREYADIPEDRLADFDWSTVVHPGDFDRVTKEWRRAFKNGMFFDTEIRLFNPSTKVYHWFASRAQPVRDASGTITQWFGTCTDIDEQKRAAQISTFISQATKELGSSLDYEKTLETVTRLSVPEVADWCSVDLYNSDTDEWDQVALAHVDSAKVEFAREYRKHHPIETNAPMGVPAVARSGQTEFHPFISDAALELLADTPEKLALAKELNIRAAIIAPIFIKDKPSGAITFVSSDSDRQYTISDLQMAEKLAGRISLAVTNATVYKEAQEELDRRHELEKQLRQEKNKLEVRVKARTQQLEDANQGLRAEIDRRRGAEAELKRSNQELEDFAYVASHDLQEPLRKIQAFGDILENEYGDKLEDGAEYLKRMHAAATRMSKLIEDLLAFSRVSTRPPALDRVDLNKIVYEVLGDLEDQIARTKGRVDVGKLPTVIADPTHLRQLFQNLISNALKFHRMDTPPVVTIDAKPCDEPNCSDYEIIVTDNGIGFDQKYVDRIFGVFQRLHGRDSYEGTGIGLAVCRKIVEQYGGTITAESQKGEGAKFTINIPVAEKEAKSDD